MEPPKQSIRPLPKEASPTTTMNYKNDDNDDDNNLNNSETMKVTTARPTEDGDNDNEDDDTTTTCSYYIILFYKYHPLSDQNQIVELYRSALENLCRLLQLKGRILVGCNVHRSEGINGTLSGTKPNLERFCHALLQKASPVEEGIMNKGIDDNSSTTSSDSVLQIFWKACDEFYRRAECPPLTMMANEFKWSRCCCSQQYQTKQDPHNSQQAQQHSLFPDLNIKITKELIGTGGVLADIPLSEFVNPGYYLTPQQWHERVKQYNNRQLLKKKQRKQESNDDCGDVNEGDDDDEDDDTILIDCRNTKECQIGHFHGAVNPQTTTFGQFTTWVQNHKHTLETKKTVLMYCTGGIRCEKASAYIRRIVPTIHEVRHLQGGIHKYLEEYESCRDSLSMLGPSLFKGKNFVFDGRGAHGPIMEKIQTECNNDFDQPETKTSSVTVTSQDTVVVGTCRYCCDVYDTYDPHCVCTVCREPTLVCLQCQSKYKEYHCNSHQHLEDCYFTNLEMFAAEELQRQHQHLRNLMLEIAVGKKFRQRRKTLQKQCEKIQARLHYLETTIDDGEKRQSTIHTDITPDTERKCRNCGQVGCSGHCWGYHGLKRKRIIENRKQQQHQHQEHHMVVAVEQHATPKNKGKHNQTAKRQKELDRWQETKEWIEQGLVQPPWVGRDPTTGIRVPPPCFRVLKTTTKAKWCGHSLIQMLQTEFPDFQQIHNLRPILQNGLLRVNDFPVPSIKVAETMVLKNMDIVSRVVHWHEPPVHLPSERIEVKKIQLPLELFPQMDNDMVIDHFVYVCNKPSSVPVHPTGPYLSNSLTVLVEAQEGLPPRTLIPCHRIDRATSGLMICCTNPRVARLIQSTINQGNVNGRVRKHYVAKVHGRFPSTSTDADSNSFPVPTESAHWKWISEADAVSDCIKLKSSALGVIQVDAPVETVDPANGIRKITSSGKPSTSHFQFIEYDIHNDTSLVSCNPKTGRSHQLRVHLQWLGFPIVNDLQYGGLMMKDSVTPMGVLDALIKGSLHKVPNNGEEQGAKAICRTCSDGPTSSFTQAQLLQGGHSICLHACRYKLTLVPATPGKSKPKKSLVDTPMIDDKVEESCSKKLHHTIDVSVDLPSWALDHDEQLFKKEMISCLDGTSCRKQTTRIQSSLSHFNLLSMLCFLSLVLMTLQSFTVAFTLRPRYSNIPKVGPLYSGDGIAQDYRWHEEAFEIEVTVKVPKETRASDIHFKAKPNSIELRLKQDDLESKEGRYLLDPRRELRDKLVLDGTFWVFTDPDGISDDVEPYREVTVTVEKQIRTPKDDFDVIEYDWKGVFKNDEEEVSYRKYDEPEDLDVREYASSLGVDIDNMNMSLVDKDMFSSGLNVTKSSFDSLKEAGLMNEVTRQEDGSEWITDDEGETVPFSSFGPSVSGQEAKSAFEKKDDRKSLTKRTVPFLDTDSPWHKAVPVNQMPKKEIVSHPVENQSLIDNERARDRAEKKQQLRHQLDKDAVDPISTLTVARLREILREQGLKVSGNKKELQDRLRAKVRSMVKSPSTPPNSDESTTDNPTK